MTHDDKLNPYSAYLHPRRPGTMSIPLRGQNDIGTSAQNSVVINDDSLESFHAQISKRGAQWIIKAVSPRAHCKVDGVRVAEAILTDKSLVELGSISFVFSLSRLEENLPTSKNIEWNVQLQSLCNFARSDSTVMILGESGTGKEVLARWIHRLSPRAHNPMTTINCSALSESLIESELFGHVKGSFTGATSDRKGAFETARGGTLFLDEIGDLPLSLQPKLLRVLENKEVRPVGSDTTYQCDVRVIAATHKPLAEMVKTGLFREDLFYRLNVCLVKVPKLIHRMEDFENLLYTFAREAKVSFSHGAIESLKAHTWPGNVRELRNLVFRAKAYYPGQAITPKEIGSLIDSPPENLTSMSRRWGEAPLSFIKNLERQLIIERLIFHKGCQRRVAEDLGLPKSTLNDRIQSYGIKIRDLVPQRSGKLVG